MARNPLLRLSIIPSRDSIYLSHPCIIGIQAALLILNMWECHRTGRKPNIGHDEEKDPDLENMKLLCRLSLLSVFGRLTC